MSDTTMAPKLNFEVMSDTCNITVGYARTNIIGSRTSFVLAHIEIYVFRGNPFQAHSLEHSSHPTQPFKQEKCNTK